MAEVRAVPDIPPYAGVLKSTSVPLGKGVEVAQTSTALRRARVRGSTGIALRSVASTAASTITAIAVAYLIWEKLRTFLGDPLVALMLVLLLTVMIILLIYDRRT